MPNTVTLHRVLRAKPERVYKAFLDPDALVKWLPPHGFTARVQHMDARVGGSFRMSFTNFGTELHVVQDGIPDMIPVEACYLGCQESLELLAKLVDPEIPDGA